MVAKAKVRIEGEDATAAAFKSALGNAQKTANKMSGAFKAAFAGISVASIVGIGKTAIALGDDLSNAAKNAGIAGSAMSELAYVAKQSDIELTTLSKSIKTMKVNLSEAASGAKAPIATLKAIGVEIKDLRGLKADEQFEIIGDAISRMGDATDRSRALNEIFGKGGEDIGRAFENGAEGVRKMREEAIATGAALSDETIKRLAETDDAVKKLQGSWEGFAARMTSHIAPSLKTAMDFWSDAPRTLNEQIADLEIKWWEAAGDRGSSQKTKRDYIEKQLADLRKRAKEESMREMGIGDKAEDKPTPPGFIDEAALKEEERLQKEREELFADTDQKIGDAHFAALEDQHIAQMELENDLSEAQIENAKKLDEWREEQAKALSENAQLFKDAFLNAWDDMVNTGKFKIDELFKYLIAEFARRGIAKLFDSMFAGSGSVGGGGGGGAMAGWAGTAINWAGKLLGFAGGGKPRAGVPYVVGEEGPEVRIDGPGTIFPNNALAGGAPNVTINYNVHAPGATVEFLQRLPQILKQHGDSVKADLIEGLRRRKFAV